MSSRDQILRNLRAAQTPFSDVPSIPERRSMVPMEGRSLLDRFSQQAALLGCVVNVFDDPGAAVSHILGLIGHDPSVLSWDLDHIPLPGLGEALAGAGIQIAPLDDASVRVGLTGVDAAVAGTGSLVMMSGAGTPRQPSLLPQVHVAVIRQDQLVPTFEDWMARQRALGLDHFRSASNVVLISGPSRTADIANELVIGVHGPGTVQIVIV